MSPIKARARLRPMLAPLALALLCSSCAGEDAPKDPESAPKMWTGEVSGTDVMVALADRDGATTLFFCGGETSFETRTRWFNEPVLLTEQFSFMANGWRVEGTLEDGVAAGVVQPEGGEESTWTATPVVPGTAAGLYEGLAPCGKLGLIVAQETPDDEAFGQGACTRIENEVSIIEQVNPVRLERNADQGIDVTVGDSNEEFTVLPAVSAAR